MIAAIYARKSTTQAAEAQDRSVARQVANARAFAASKGWTVADEHVYVDDGISGAETKRLVAKQRLLSVIRAGMAPFQVLVLQSNDRLSRRDGEEALGELKAIDRAGVAVWFYAEGQPFAHGTFASNTLGFLRAEFAAEFRRAIACKTSEAMRRKAQLGHVTGGAVFGYDNVRMTSHTERRICEPQAVVVRRIFELYASGLGFIGIAKQLNVDGAACPRPQRGRPAGWAPSSIREILRRPLYRGEVIYGRSKKRNTDMEVSPKRQAPQSWLRIPAPQLRIVPEDLARAVDERLEGMRDRTLRSQKNGRLLGRPPGEGARYLLTGLVTCAVCGGGFEALSRQHGRRRAFVYGCATHRRKGASVCANGLVVAMEVADESILTAIEETLLHPAVVTRALDHATATIQAMRGDDRRGPLQGELTTLDQAVVRLTAAIASGGELSPLVEALRLQEARRQEIRATLTVLDTPLPSMKSDEVRARLTSALTDWRGLLRAHVAQGQQAIRRLIRGKFRFTPRPDGTYAFNAIGTVRPLLGGLVQKLASPAGFEPAF